MAFEKVQNEELLLQQARHETQMSENKIELREANAELAQSRANRGIDELHASESQALSDKRIAELEKALKALWCFTVTLDP